MAETDDPSALGAEAALESFYDALNNRGIDALRADRPPHPLVRLNNPVGGILHGEDAIAGLYGKVLPRLPERTGDLRRRHRPRRGGTRRLRRPGDRQPDRTRRHHPRCDPEQPSSPLPDWPLAPVPPPRQHRRRRCPPRLPAGRSRIAMPPGHGRPRSHSIAPGHQGTRAVRSGHGQATRRRFTPAARHQHSTPWTRPAAPTAHPPPRTAPGGPRPTRADPPHRARGSGRPARAPARLGAPFASAPPVAAARLHTPRRHHETDFRPLPGQQLRLG
jgi:hypothetical protein